MMDELAGSRYTTIVLFREVVMPVSIKETTSIKLDKQAKEEARLIFKELGITMGDAFNMFLSQVNLHKGIPFEIKIPNELTKQVIREARLGKNVQDFSIDELNQ
jgi:DNA-damage-inducible protein J